MKSADIPVKPLRSLLVAGIFLAALPGLSAADDTSQRLDLWPKTQSPVMAPEVETQVEALLKKMTLEQKVGQIMQPEIQSITPEEVKKYHIGSVLNGGGSIPGRKENAGPDDWLALADALWEASMDSSDGGVAIPIIWGTDAVHGNGNLTGATLFPHNIGLGATGNPDLVRAIGAATAAEVRTTGVEWVFAPTLAVAQNDLWGRTYESYSEDPQVVKTFASAMVEGLQGTVGADDFLSETRVLATAKHFLADGGTFEGDDQGDARISEQELVDIHNAGYPAVIESGVQSVMASFSSWNGEKHHGNQYLLTDVLKKRMGFDGLVVGDWNGHGQVVGCTNDNCPQAINAGIDLLMVTYDWKNMIANTLTQVNSGEISMARLDDAVRRILRVKLRAGLFDKKPSERTFAGDEAIVGSAEHRALARRAVRESMVLLKNRDGLLPLNPQQNILVAGPGADSIAMQSGGWSVSWQGAGIPNDKFPGATSIYRGIKQAVEAAGGNALLAVDGEFSKKPDVAIVVFGESPYAEGQGDRNTLEFEPGNKESLALLKKFNAEGIPVVSVFLSGRPMWVNPEINGSNAFVAAWLPGTEGDGVADMLIADEQGKARYDFTGRLSFSWPGLPLQAKLNPHHDDYAPQFALGYGLSLYAEYEGPARLTENVPGLLKGEPKSYALYQGRPLQPWGVQIDDFEQNQMLSGAFAKLPSGRVTVVTSDKDVQEDALTFKWQDTWLARLSLQHGGPLDLSNYVEQGVLTFDLKVDDLEGADLALELQCGHECERRVDLTLQARENIGKGWQRESYKLSCFVREGDDFSQIRVPFSLRAGGKGQVAVANVRLEKSARASDSCPDYRTLATTPDTRHEYWSKGWWDERFQRNQQRLAEGNVDLLMLGDSITEGWEKEGKSVWENFYADRNAVNLGYGGDRTENLLWRLQNGELDGIQPKAGVVLIGTNNTGHRLEDPALTAAGIRAVLEELRARQPQMKILLLSIFPRDPKPGTPMRRVNQGINDIIEEFADGEHIFYQEIYREFLQDDGELSTEIMPDYLHLSESGYQIWAEAMEPTLSRLLD
ncbi:glycoside hydrolase family 3 N-terminal domain-containing protein [Microbulbifer bruguierae]|uniref:Glycoside hydrolase family 3 N-terminal domain-containing protein n=1 Tax=Microbulbifer bruguierae TaxID=3029061 RepID=A0ABY8NHJ6_9GAMM|nr:glycoside hydrolase family 3 N-terminal domain-containing protein [Microbulbifer bruguierae]WGL18401.1 glycoside hydrolase family 3 N-terminal domain-containing protein [Microbulbifer bruguierae]